MGQSSRQSHLQPIEEIVYTNQNDRDEIRNVIQSSISAIKTSNDSTNAVIWTDEEFIENEINRVEKLATLEKHDFPLLGVPILVKEIDSPIAGTPNSWGNIQLKSQQFCDDTTATSVLKLQNSGAVIVGKTNNPELALTVTTKSKAHGPCTNPLDILRNSGGSSGGSAAAVASGMVSVATGSDGGGSIRIPAAACGVYGFKPSRGVISLGPVFEEFWAGLVCKGVIASNLSDIVSVFNVLAKNPTKQSEIPQKKLRIGIRTDGFGTMYDMDESVVVATNKVADFLSDAGHDVVFSSPSSFDDISIIDPFLNIIAYNTFLDVTELTRRLTTGFDLELCEDETIYFYKKGMNQSRNDYKDACNFIAPFTQACDSWFEDFDILITPTIGNVAPIHGEVEKDLDLNPFIYSGLTFPSNIIGAPSLTIPVKSTHETGLPVGVQIVSKNGNDKLVLKIGKILESDYSDIFVT